MSMSLCLRAPEPLQRRAVARREPLQVCDVDHPDRADVEHFIRQVYARQFDADVQHFAPNLVFLRDANDRIVAAAGYRSGGDDALFLERYLPRPIEQMLAIEGAATPSRSVIVEVGHLSASKSGEGRRLIALLAVHLAAQEFEWAVTTVTTELLALFVRIGLTPRALAAAEPAALGEEARLWGRYYEHSPTVVCGTLQHALHQLALRAPESSRPR
ncbi:N/A [soil metagenome]